MKRKHTEKKSANRARYFGEDSGSPMSIARWEKRMSFHKAEKKSYGCQVRRVQRIEMKKRTGTLIVTTVVKFIDHYDK